ncbi:MAG: bacteriohemerythrin [Deltaproteobacteria bacterium]|nr:bacteriohemerythrin [Deltaproteobacteria bacterium]
MSVKIEPIDNQHKKLIIAINALEQAMEDNESKGILTKLIAALKAYTDKHFSYEEEFLIKNSYPDIKEHQIKHREIIDQVLYYEKKLEQEENYLIDFEMLDFLKNWLLSHIMVEDMKYSKFLVDKDLQ